MDPDQSAEKKSTASSTAISSLDVICKVALSHSLLSEEDIATIRQALNEKGLEQTPQNLVRSAIQLRKMTLFQGKLLLSKDPKSLSLGTYLILDKIGQGGMGSVYKAKHKSMERVVAIKVLRRQATLSGDSIKRFQREVLAAGKLIHPNIVTAFDAGEQNGVHYLVMEFVGGEDLKSLVDRKGASPISEAVDYILQASKALQYAHQKQIIHRDIKPANLLLDQSGTVKVLDMGLARIMKEAEDDQQHSLTADGAVMGTVDYLPPEQSFDTKSADERSDIYSLGCTLFTLLTGRPVYSGNTLVQKILAHRESEVPSLKSFCPSVPDALDGLFQRMVAKNPDARPQSMSVVVDLLEKIVTGKLSTDTIGGGQAKVSSQDAFLETLILGATDTISSSASISPSTVAIESKSTLPQPIVSPVKRTKPKKNFLPLAVVGASIVLISLVMCGFWLTSPRTAEITLRYSANDLEAMRGATIKLDHGITIPLQVNANKEQVIELPVDTVRHSLAVERQGYETFTHSFSYDDANSLIVPFSLRKQIVLPEIASITLRFSGAEADGATIQVDDGKSVPVKRDAGNQQLVRIPFDRLTHSLIVTKEGHEPFTQQFQFDATKAFAADVSLKQSMPPPEVAVPPAESDVATRPSSSSMPNTEQPRTIVVGVGAGEVPEFMDALKQAKPRDTILIRHRGPLDIEPIDLTDKMPLTIQGDQQSNIDFWPILRQKYGVQGSNGEVPSESGGFFSGDKLELEFKNLHLAVGGANRNSVVSLFRTNSGSIAFENCTVTASTDNAERSSVGASMDFVTLTGRSSDHLEVQLNNTLIRGARFSHFVHIPNTAKASIEANQAIWAGGQGAFISLGHGNSSANLSLQHCTLYNLASLLKIPDDRITGSVENFVNVDLKNSIILAHDKGRADFVKLGGVERTTGDNNRWQRFLSFQCDKTTIANFDSWIPSIQTVSKVADFKLFKTLFNITEANMLDDKLPRLKVFPAGVELQEVQARDLQCVDGWSNRAVTKDLEKEYRIGAISADLPIALSRVSERDPASPELAAKPRGLPKIIQVNKKLGPEHSLEEAFKRIQGEDVVIEITDSETYMPIRDFGIDNKGGVLFSDSAKYIAIRAAPSESPKIVLSDADQVGKVPDLSRFFDKLRPNPQLFLFNINCQSLELEGLVFEMQITRNMYHSVLTTNANYLKVTNCIVDDKSSASHAINARNGYFVVVGTSNSLLVPGANIYWIENVIVDHVMPVNTMTPGDIDVHASTAFSLAPVGGLSSHVVLRNTLVKENVFALNSDLDGWLQVENVTMLGRLFRVNGSIRSAEVKDSVFIVTPDPIILDPSDALNTVNVVGGNNIVWGISFAITDANRNEGFLRWLPGPVLKAFPEFDRNTLQVKKTRRTATQMDDDGFVGVRTDRISNFKRSK
jgi:serine/threonine protein kinase